MLMDRQAADGDVEWLMLDRTIARRSAAIHPHSGRRQRTPAGCALLPALPGQKSEGKQCLGRSRGGWSSKLRDLADGLGNPLRFALTAGQSGDAPEAIPLLDTVSIISVQAVLADRADDCNAVLDRIGEHGAVPVIPTHQARGGTRHTGWHFDKKRVKIEFLFGKMKHFRRDFCRFEKARPALSRIRASRRRLHPVTESCQRRLTRTEPWFKLAHFALAMHVGSPTGFNPAAEASTERGVGSFGRMARWYQAR